MEKVYVISDNIVNSLGFTTDEVSSSVKNNITGFKMCDDRDVTPAPIPLSRVDNERLEEKFNEILLQYPGNKEKKFTRMEKIFIVSINDALSKTKVDTTASDSLLIISTTKGNIDLLAPAKKNEFLPERLLLWKMADEIAGFFGFSTKPLIISNACISGVMALSTAARYISSGFYKNIVVSGGDLASEFVVSGFLSFQALSNEPCRPFDADRTGLSLGEGAGTMILSSSPADIKENIRIAGSAITNDANHISGPSRTGEELALAITRSLHEASLEPSEIDFISAHGTATVYNDEMESKAITIAGAENSPVNSFKGYWGHTLGAAGVIESVMTVCSMRQNMLFSSPGYNENGTPHPLNVIRENFLTSVNNCLKIASGFGGCNGAIIFRKD